MCWPSCRGGAYISVAVFIYRSIMITIAMISSSILRRKMTYLPLSVMEELLLHLIYLIPLFTSSCFILIGIESNSFNYTFYSTLLLSFTLYLRYGLELVWIWMQGWKEYWLKLPSLILYLGVDSILLLVLLLFARSRLRYKTTRSKINEDEEADLEEEILVVTRGHAKSPKAKNDMKSNNRNSYPLQRSPKRSYTPGSASAGSRSYSFPRMIRDELDELSIPPDAPLAPPPDEEDLRDYQDRK